MAARVAGLSERPDYGRTSGYLDEPVDVREPKKLKDWVRTDDGMDLLHLVRSLQAEMKKDSPVEVPHLLKKMVNSASGVLSYIKS